MHKDIKKKIFVEDWGIKHNHLMKILVPLTTSWCKPVDECMPNHNGLDSFLQVSKGMLLPWSNCVKLPQTPTCQQGFWCHIYNLGRRQQSCTEVKSPRIENRSEKTELFNFCLLFLVDSMEEGNISIHYFILVTLSRNKTSNQEVKNKMRE